MAPPPTPLQVAPARDRTVPTARGWLAIVCPRWATFCRRARQAAHEDTSDNEAAPGGRPMVDA